MTLTIKKIRGNEYYYYQDSVKDETGKSKVLGTCVCRVDEEGKKIIDSKIKAAQNHVAKLIPTMKNMFMESYTFENVALIADLKVSTELQTKAITVLLDVSRLLYKLYMTMLTVEEVEDFKNVLFTKYVHGTTAIEGNTLNENETHKLLSASLTPQNKTVNETLEVANYVSVRNHMKNYKGPINEKIVRHVHKLLLMGIKGENEKLIDAGNYRTNQVILRNIGFRPPPAELVPTQLGYLLDDYDTKITKKIHPIEAATFFHQKFEEIHPFQDGNGRLGRELLNYMLTREGFPPIYIIPDQRSVYLTALQEGNTENFQPLFEFVCTRMFATVAYLSIHTNLYDVLTSPEAQQSAKDNDMEEGYTQFLALAKQLRDNNENP